MRSSPLGWLRTPRPARRDLPRRSGSRPRAPHPAIRPPWRGLSILATLLFAAHLSAAPGDIRVEVQDVEGRPLTPASGVNVVLRGLDESGYRTVASLSPDASGTIVFKADSIAKAVRGRFHFVLESQAAGVEVRGLLYDPFGLEATYLGYQPDFDYAFVLPTPTWGQAAPEIRWAGAQSQLRFAIDLGARRSDDFWILRTVWQKKATGADFVGSEFGLLPLLAAEWLAQHGYAVADEGLLPGQTGSVRLTQGSYAETFTARKEQPAGGLAHAYLVGLLNCLWTHALPAAYDPSAKTCTFTFDPTAVFLDTNAPAWDGAGMKDSVPYFLSLQAQTWVWHPAGAAGGVAIDWGAGTALSLFHPVRLNDQTIRLEISPEAKDVVRLRFHANANLPYTLESSPGIAGAVAWQSLTNFTPSTSPFEFIDAAATSPTRFYRLRQK